MLKKNLSIYFIILMFIVSFIFFVPHDKTYKIQEVISPIEFKINNKTYLLKNLEIFDTYYSEHNSNLAKSLNISETDAFILGNIGKYWTSNFMNGRNIYFDDNDLIYNRNRYSTKLMHSGFCFKDSNPCDKEAFYKRLAEIHRAKYKIVDLDTQQIYKAEQGKDFLPQNYILVRTSHLQKENKDIKTPSVLDKGNVRILFADSTKNLKPYRTCSSDICQEILYNINNAQKTIDMAIYGYSTVPTIEDALKKAQKRGVKIRLIYDVDSFSKNIYPDTNKIISIIPNSKNDASSSDVNNIMHNKFYIFDSKILITGSANLSHTDMSGFNSNSIIVINSQEVAKIYEKEFEQMYNGKYHSEKIPTDIHKISVSGIDLQTYFSPQDKTITHAVLPLIRNAKKYIYIPTFVLTERRVTEELIKAKQRGVDVKIIMDALNASTKHSKHRELRGGGVPVKTENYAGKMHSKSMIIDDEYTIIGSMNFSYSGENKNDENLIVIKDKTIAEFYKNFFLYQWGKIDEKWLKFNARAEGKDSIGSCFDGIDNNYDGLTDNQDLACK